MMKVQNRIIAVLFWTAALCGSPASANNPLTEQHKGFTLHYTAADEPHKQEIINLIENGMTEVRRFFKVGFNNRFDVYIHPDRHSLDSAWQKDWGMPGFHSECWMVASGVATRLDMLSPAHWETQACEHKYADSVKTQRLITHELVHVFHGQHNASPDFSSTEGIDWFVEGLATFASGQCDQARLAEVKKAVAEDKIPAGLDDFWTGRMKYGLSGSMVLYIDKKYGRSKLKEMLRYNTKTALLTALKVTETALLEGWKEFIATN